MSTAAKVGIQDIPALNIVHVDIGSFDILP
jgi:hypothetical protein